MSGLRSGATYGPGPALVDPSIIADGGGHSWALHVCAHPGNLRDMATPMRAAINVVDMAQADGDSVALPPATGGQLTYIENRTPHAVTVWAASGTQDTIFSAGASQSSTSYTLPSNSMTMLVSTPGQWAIPPSNWSGGLGVTDGSNAGAGQIGEYLTAQCLSTAAVPLTTGVDSVVTTLQLSAGDWDAWGSSGFSVTNNNQTFLSGWLNPAGSSRPSIDQMGGNYTAPLMSNQVSTVISPLAAMRISTSSPSTVTLGATATFAGGGTVAAWGKIMARRRR